MTELYLLGPAEIRNERGELEHSFLSGPKRLALLTYLLLHNPGGFHRRDSLLPMFWPYQGQKSARNALSNMLYHIRQSLGKDAVENRGSEEIRLDPEVFWCDVPAFEEALIEKNYKEGMDHFRGDLLKGFHVHDISAEFDQWLEQERKKFHALAVKACREQAEKAALQNNYDSAIHWAGKLAALEPFSEPAHIQLINYLDEAGDQQAALATWEKFAKRINSEFGEDPGPEFKALKEKIKFRKPAASPPAATDSPFRSSASSIAVLPFETLGRDKASTFTDAIHGDILTRLSQVSDLFVISRTSVQSFRGTKKLLREIGRELQVEWILTGEVQEIDKHVKVSVRLVLASEDRQVWAEIYQRRLTADEIFNIQAEITQNIIKALKMRLSQKEKKAIRQVPTEDLEAFRLHAHGRWNLDKRTEDGMRLAEGCFRKALLQDSQYAQAWLGLADTLSLLHDYGHENNKEGILTEAEEAAHKALDLDPSLAEAYASLGLLYTTQRKAKAAIFNLKKAIKLRPGYAEAHAWSSWIYLLTGNNKEGLESAKKGVNVNPLSQESISNLSLAWLTNGNYEASLLEATRLQHLQPDFQTADFQKGLAFYHLGRYNEAQSLLQDLKVPWAGNGPKVTWMLSCLQSGAKQEAEKFIEELEDEPFGRGLLMAAQGKEEEAFAVFSGITHWNYWEMLSIHFFYPDLLDPVRNDKGFGKILENVNRSWGLDEKSATNTNNSFAEEGDGGSQLERRIKTAVINLAVLPFKDLDSQEPRFTDGIHGDILMALSRVKNLQVISRPSVCRYDSASKSTAEIGADLNVSWLLKGTVQQAANHLKISLRLLHASQDTPIWTSAYERKLTAENIFLLQEEITQEVLEVLEVQVRREEGGRNQRPTANLEAYRLYVMGQGGLDLRTEEGIYRGLDCFQGSIELDPGYALAWSGLADALSLLEYYGFPTPKNSPKALKAGQKAVSLDPNLSEAHTALGIAQALQHNGPAALESLEKAVHLSRGYAEGQIWLGWLNLVIGKPAQAVQPGEQAVRLNPLTPAMRVFLAEIYLANGIYKQALKEASRGREINPDYGLTHYMEGLAYYHCDRFEEAVNSFDTTLSRIPGRGSPTTAEVKTAKAFAQYALGDKSSGRKLMGEIYGRIDPFPLGMLQALYGETDEAFQTFEKVQDWSSFSTETIRYFFPEALLVLRQDKRYQTLIDKVDQVWGLRKVVGL